MKIFNPTTQQHETLTLVSQEVKTDPTDSVRTTTEIYETPNGDFVIYTTMDFLKIVTTPFVTQHGFLKKWLPLVNGSQSALISDEETVTMSKTTHSNFDTTFHTVTKIDGLETSYDFSLKSQWLTMILNHLQTTNNPMQTKNIQQIAKDFTENLLKPVNSRLSEDYKIGFEEGIVKFLISLTKDSQIINNEHIKEILSVTEYENLQSAEDCQSSCEFVYDLLADLFPDLLDKLDMTNEE